MSRFQGIGNAYYGKRDYNPINKSYITTEWFVIFLLPIFPRKSFRLIKSDKQEKNIYLINSMGHYSAVSYKILEEIPIKNNLKQVINTYVFTYGLLGLFFWSWILPSINYSLVWIPIIFMAVLLLYALVKSE